MGPFLNPFKFNAVLPEAVDAFHRDGYVAKKPPSLSERPHLQPMPHKPSELRD